MFHIDGIKEKSEREGEVGAELVETLEFYVTQGDLLTRSWVPILFAKMHCQK